MRIAKPEPVSANPAVPAGSNANRQLQDAIGGMVSRKVNVALDEADQTVTSPAAAATAAGFAVRLPRTRHDAPVLVVVGARAVDMTVDRNELRTILMEAGQSAPVPESIQGARLAVRTPRALRAQYGNCPAAANTLATQIQGTPPPSAENASCVILVQSPRATADVPAGLDMDRLTAIALELGGMSPIQAHAFQAFIPWQSALRNRSHTEYRVLVGVSNLSSSAREGLERWCTSVTIEGDRLALTVRSKDQVPEIVRHLASSGADMHEITPQREPLEELFVRIMGKDPGL